MGMFMSFMGKGLPTTQLLSSLTGTLERQFMEKDVSDFDKFHMTILDMFNTVNAALPGKHYNVPLQEEVQVCFEAWDKAEESRRKEIIMEFMMKRVNISKLDDFTLITGLVTPPAAMAAKRAGENVPQLKLIKALPDVIFVPSITVLALVSAKLSQKMILGEVGS
ncbi:uncharacterized protein LOC111383618 [Olea europaea var. sylvestris]|uniref:uncharacterized protein LOC111383618 n=1 Tax=Olea europaea var. sylvestris TaxID=158386 RepID=UPI000C1D2A06|nr:uncharacterized protein LOC111383618 [Olea europaea var. sylvestris]